MVLLVCLRSIKTSIDVSISLIEYAIVIITITAALVLVDALRFILSYAVIPFLRLSLAIQATGLFCSLALAARSS